MVTIRGRGPPLHSSPTDPCCIGFCQAMPSVCGGCCLGKNNAHHHETKHFLNAMYLFLAIFFYEIQRELKQCHTTSFSLSALHHSRPMNVPFHPYFCLMHRHGSQAHGTWGCSATDLTCNQQQKLMEMKCIHLPTDVDAAPRLPPVAAASTPLTPAASLTNERESGRQRPGAGLLQDLGPSHRTPILH